MKWINFLHFYQPHNQQLDILDRIINESYLPLVKGLVERPQARTVININGALVKLLKDQGYNQLLEGFKELGESGQAEFTGSAMYHAFLPLLPKKEIKRQVMLNQKTNKELLGDWFAPQGFFSPEMAINDKVIEVASELGFSWIGASEMALVPEKRNKLGRVRFVTNVKGKKDAKDAKMSVFFRNKRVSSLILSAVTRTAEQFLEETSDLFRDSIGTDSYWFTVMDAETFGHHRIGHEEFLFDLLDNSQIETTLAKDQIKAALPVEEIKVRPSTWTNTEQDFWLDKDQTQKSSSRSFILWKDPTNPIHQIQWELVDFVLDLLKKSSSHVSEKIWKQARQLMDKALASDQFWWASTNPWWSLEMLEQGAYQLKQVVYTLDYTEESKTKAENYYRRILDQAFDWQRSGVIRQKHLDNSATFMKKPFKDRTPPEWYNQIILEFEDEMNKAAKNRDFERAIKWRDGLIKLRQGTDIYDVLHVVDELWSARKIPELKPFLDHTWEELSDFAKKQLRAPDGEVGKLSDSDFDNWKLEKENNNSQD